MSAGHPLVAVIVVTYNSADLIADCLASIRPALGELPRSKVLVVDNASADGTCDVVRAFAPDVHVVRRAHNGGYAAGFNAGAAIVDDADALLVLNADIRLHPRSIAALVDVLDLPRTGIAVPKVLGREGRIEPSLRRESTVLRAFGEALLGGARAGRYDALGEVITRSETYAKPTTAPTASGAVMLVSRRCYDELGGWDESFFHGSEETEFCLRAGDAGWLVRYTPTAVATHLGGRSERSPQLRALMFVNRLELYRRRRGRRRAVAYRIALVLNETLRYRRGPQHRATLRALLNGQRPVVATGTDP